MAYIEVNYKELRRMASAVEEYCSVQKKELSKLKADVNSVLQNDWIGADSVEFSKKWDHLDDSSSETRKLLAGMENYAAALRKSADEYQKAKENAVNRAAMLWF